MFLLLSRGITYADPDTGTSTDTTTDTTTTTTTTTTTDTTTTNIDLTGGNPGTTGSGSQGSLLEFGQVQRTSDMQIWDLLPDGTWGPTGQTGTITWNQSQLQPGGGYYLDVNGNLTQDPNQDSQQGILTDIGYVSNNTSQEWIDRINNASSRGEALHAAAACNCWRSTFGDGGDSGGGGGGANPKGWFDPPNCSVLPGWTCDPDNYNAQLEVQFYRNGPAGGGGTLFAFTSANNANEQAVTNECGGSPNHRFNEPLPSFLKDGNPHNIYAYAKDAQTGNLKGLSGNPRQINCGAPPIPTPTPTPVPPAGSWLKVVGGDVYSGGAISMPVAPPAGQFNATDIVTSGSSITNFQTSSNWIIPNYTTSSGKFDYDYFSKRFASRAQPITSPITNDTSLNDKTIYLYNQSGDLLLLSNGANFNNKKVAILVNGNLRIQSAGNKFTPQNASVIFITSGNITIHQDMTEIKAALVSTGNTNTGAGAIPLTIKGLLVSYGGFSLGRAPASAATPGETLIYDPNLVVTLNDLIGITNFYWQEVAP